MSDDKPSVDPRIHQAATLIKDLIKAEQEARERYGIKDSFKYIPAELKAIWDRFIEETGYDPEQAGIDAREDTLWPLPAPGQIPVYIYLYHAQGSNLESWLQLLSPKALAELAITRPIYQEERYVQRFFEKHPHQPHYGYLVVYAQAADLVAPDPRFAVDREGHPLVRFRERFLTPDRIVGLVHNTLGRFVFRRGQLVRLPS